MQHWKQTAIDVLREASIRALLAGDLELRGMTLEAIAALQSEGLEVSPDDRVYQMMLRELFGVPGRRTEATAAIQDPAKGDAHGLR